jgi:hypothetical protein
MAPPTPSSTPVEAPMNRSGSARFIEKYEDMTLEERYLANDIIDVLGERNLTNEKANDQTREWFWRSVFRTKWNTNQANIHPGPLPDRQFTESAICIGRFNQDLPPSKGVARRASQEDRRPPAPERTPTPPRACLP